MTSERKLCFKPESGMYHIDTDLRKYHFEININLQPQTFGSKLFI